MSSEVAEYTDVNMHIFNHFKSAWKFSTVQRPPPSEMALASWKVPLFRPYVLLVRTTCRWRSVCRNGGM